MSIDATKHIALLEILRSGKPAVGEYLKVEWPSGTKYYGNTALSRISPFRDVKNYTGGAHIEPRLIGDPFQQFEINGDIRTENINVHLDDPDSSIKTLFETHGAVRCELFVFYPQVNLNVSVWWGQILAPQIYGRYSHKTVLTNGYRARERSLPYSTSPKECRFTSRFGGKLDTADKITTNGCPYDLGVGGTVGVLDSTTGLPYRSCDGSVASCTARFGHRRFYGGTELNAAAVQSDGRAGNLTFTKGNASARNKPAAWIFGQKTYRGSDVLLWTRRPNTSNPDRAFVTFISRIGEGPLQAVSNLRVNDQHQDDGQDWAVYRGLRGQPSLSGGYPGLSANENFSSTAVFLNTYGWVDPNVTAISLTTSLDVSGYAAVAVFTDAVTFTRKWSNDRLWCLLETYTNQKCGLGGEHARFWIEDFLAVSEWGRKNVTFSFTSDDGEVRTFPHRRTTFDAALEGRPAVDQITDICRSGRISLPYQYDGKYSIDHTGAFTDEELEDAITFYDSGRNLNIVYDGADLPVMFSPIPDDKLTNEIVLTYEEATNFDIPRTITIADSDQQAKAANLLGDSAFQVSSKQFVGLGIRNHNEAVKFAHSLIYFGDPLGQWPEVGGIKNNLPVKHVTQFERTLRLKRYMPYRLELTTMDIPLAPNGTYQVETATATGTASGSGNITVTVTRSGSSLATPVAILNGDTPAVWAVKVRTALQGTALNDLFYIAVVNTNKIRLTAKSRAANDSTLNIAIAAGTTGITAAPTSVNTTAGVADTPFEYFQCLGITRLPGNLAEITGIGYNHTASESFEVESLSPPVSAYCSTNADCPAGTVCRDGVCVPIGGGPICFRTPSVSYGTGQIEIEVPPC